jgi:hypothetical protein
VNRRIYQNKIKNEINLSKKNNDILLMSWKYYIERLDFETLIRLKYKFIFNAKRAVRRKSTFNFITICLTIISLLITVGLTINFSKFQNQLSIIEDIAQGETEIGKNNIEENSETNKVKLKIMNINGIYVDMVNNISTEMVGYIEGVQKGVLMAIFFIIFAIAIGSYAMSENEKNASYYETLVIMVEDEMRKFENSNSSNLIT